jgi:L,D-transpeptidase YcbB
MRKPRDFAYLFAALIIVSASPALAEDPGGAAYVPGQQPALTAPAPDAVVVAPLAEPQAMEAPGPTVQAAEVPGPVEAAPETAEAAAPGAPVPAGEPDAGQAVEEIAGDDPAELPPQIEAPAVLAEPVAPAEPAGAAPPAVPHFDVQPELAGPVQSLESVIAARLSADRKDQEIATFYAERGNAPLWIDNGRLGERARDAIARIARADEDGLDVSGFVLPDANGTDGSFEALASAEIALSKAAVSYARQAQGGRIEPSSVSAYITAKPVRPARAEVLAKLADARDVSVALDAYNPPHDGYTALRQRLAELRAEKRNVEVVPPVVPPGATLKAGMEDDRVPLLRARLSLPAGADNFYDDALVAAVRDWQARSGLKPDGIVGRRSIEKLNDHGTADSEIKLVLVNMERWRWLPHDLGQTHILVNVPEYMARIVRDGSVIHETRVIVGKPANQTPIFSDKMQFMVVNPAWNVPSSIATKEMLPNLQRDPYYLARQGMEVLYTGGKKPVVVDSTTIDWSRVDMRQIRVRQPPGERNALGNIKFMFPNEHAVYLHDTPNRNLFANAQRAYSHGCVRVQDPFALADVLLEDSDWNSERLKRFIGSRGERRINLAHHVPIHMVYFTAEAGSGTMVKYADIYGHDRRMKSLLSLDGRAQASIRLTR